MGTKQSTLKKELEALKAEVQATAAKHKEELDALRDEVETAAARHKQELDAVLNEKQVLEQKVGELQHQTDEAQREVESTREAAQQREERMQALKWELIRQMRLSGTGMSPASRRTSASEPDAASPRASLNWKLKDEAVARQSVTSSKAVRSAASGCQATEQVIGKPKGEAGCSASEPPTATVDSERHEEGLEPTESANSPNQVAVSDTNAEEEKAQPPVAFEVSGDSDVDSDDASDASSSEPVKATWSKSIASSSAEDKVHGVEHGEEPTVDAKGSSDGAPANANANANSPEADDVLDFSDEEEEAGSNCSKAQ